MVLITTLSETLAWNYILSTGEFFLKLALAGCLGAAISYYFFSLDFRRK